MKSFFVCILLAVASMLFAQKKVFDIRSYGANADGHTNNAIPIQKAIEEASASGAGVVLVPAGTFVTGVIHLKSNVELQLAANAVLAGSTKRSDYGPKDASALIVASGQHNISIKGKGTINGQAAELLKDIYVMLKAGTLEDNEWQTENEWHQVRPAERNRPKLIEFVDCDAVEIKGITLRDGLDWIQKYNNCSGLTIDSIRVESTTFLNNDGIDIVDCKNVRVTNSVINAADDGICLKSEDRQRKNICENIYIADCSVRSSASAIKFGTASWSGFRNITIKNIKVYDTYRSAVALEVVDGAFMENINVSNIQAVNVGCAIFVRLGHRNKDAVSSSLKHVRISNMKAQIPAGKPDKGYREEGPVVREPHNVFPSSITGLAGHPVEGLVLEDIDITYAGGASKKTAYFASDSLTRVPENASAYPEFSMFGELPAWGMYVRHAKGITFKNVRLQYKNDDFRSAMIFDDVDSLRLTDLIIPRSASYPVIILNNVTHPALKRMQVPAKNGTEILSTNKK